MFVEKLSSIFVRNFPKQTKKRVKSKTKIYKSYDSNILETLFVKYNVSKYYIRQCVNGSVHGIKPDNIKSDYVKMEKANKDLVANLIRKPLE